MRLLFIGYLHGFGGMEKQITMLANEMSRRGHEVFFLALSEFNICFDFVEDVRVDFFEDRSSSRIKNIILRYLYLRSKIKETVPDLIINFNFQSAYFCSFLGRKTSSISIYAERGDPSDKQYTGIMALIRWFCLRRIKGVVFQTKYAQEYFPSYITRKSTVINNPIFFDPDEYPRTDDPEKRIVSVGRLHEQKNQKVLIRAIKLLSSKYNDYSVEIYGEGELRPELEKLINELGLSDRIHLVGAYRDVLERIKNAAVFVLSSDYEGMPNALAEAMALGLPCVSTDCRPGGAKELITSGVDGIIVPVNDAEQLAKGIETILSSKTLQIKYSNNAKKRVKKLVANKIYNQWESFFKMIEQ